jgi:hypothetical protein
MSKLLQHLVLVSLLRQPANNEQQERCSVPGMSYLAKMKEHERKAAGEGVGVGVGVGNNM